MSFELVIGNISSWNDFVNLMSQVRQSEIEQISLVSLELVIVSISVSLGLFVCPYASTLCEHAKKCAHIHITGLLCVVVRARTLRIFRSCSASLCSPSAHCM